VRHSAINPPNRKGLYRRGIERSAYEKVEERQTSLTIGEKDSPQLGKDSKSGKGVMTSKLPLVVKGVRDKPGKKTGLCKREKRRTSGSGGSFQGRGITRLLVMGNRRLGFKHALGSEREEGEFSV